MLIEYLAHLVLHQARAFSAVPVVVNGTVVGRGPRGRECVSLDFSHVGDPLDTRLIRVAFGAYQWHRFRPDIFGVSAAEPAATGRAAATSRAAHVDTALATRPGGGAAPGTP